MIESFIDAKNIMEMFDKVTGILITSDRFQPSFSKLDFARSMFETKNQTSNKIQTKL